MRPLIASVQRALFNVLRVGAEAIERMEGTVAPHGLR
jgi:hypothetical protein